MSSPLPALISRRSVAIPPGAPVLLAVVKNEMLRLPYLIAYYRKLGFAHFLFVDNDSTDGTREFLLEQPDIFVFHTKESFGAHPGAGLLWKNALLDRYCDGHWVLVADADELLIWPEVEREDIRALTRKMDKDGAKAVFTLMLDMYSDKPFGEIGYKPGLPFLDYSPYFDPKPFTLYRMNRYPYGEIWGGVRCRIFKAEAPKLHPPTISKVPLVRWHKGQKFAMAQHALLTALPLAPMRGALLHFKMFDDLPVKCESDSARREYYEEGREYRILADAIRKAPNRSFYDPEISVRYEGPDQLVALGLMLPYGTPVKSNLG